MGYSIDNYGCMGETEGEILSKEGWEEGDKRGNTGSDS